MQGGVSTVVEIDSCGIRGEFLSGQLAEIELGRGGVFSEAEADIGRGVILSRG
jgi:hypothetical protein